MEGALSAVLLAAAFAVVAVTAIVIAGLLYRVSGGSRPTRPASRTRPAGGTRDAD